MLSMGEMRNRKGGMTGTRVLSVGLVILAFVNQVACQQCGSTVGGAVCADNLCCSQYGYCGSTAEYCCDGCQSQCNCGSSCSGGTSSGRASYYTAPYTPSACFGNDQNQFTQYFAAGGDGNPNIWDDGRNCGRFFNVQCTGNGCRNSNTISVKIVDRCPNGCVNGRAFDLSEATFNAIADPAVGEITINYCAQ